MNYAQIQSTCTEIAEFCHFGSEARPEWNFAKAIAFVKQHFIKRTDYQPDKSIFPNRTAWQLDLSEHGWAHIFDFTVDDDSKEIVSSDWCVYENHEWVDAIELFYPQ